MSNDRLAELCDQHEKRELETRIGNREINTMTKHDECDMRRLLTTNEPVLRTPQSRSTWHLLDASVACVVCRSIGSAASFARRDGSGPAASCSASRAAAAAAAGGASPACKSAVTARAGRRAEPASPREPAQRVAQHSRPPLRRGAFADAQRPARGR